jgi:hypothetical protein
MFFSEFWYCLCWISFYHTTIAAIDEYPASQSFVNAIRAFGLTAMIFLTDRIVFPILFYTKRISYQSYPVLQIIEE